MNNMKYSVLMSIYYKEKASFFIESIESILRQTIKPDEIVIVKDGPLTFELDEVINKYTEQEPDIFKIVSLKENVGLGLALNEGLKKCKNEYVARMDSDDISLEMRCQMQLKEFKRDNSLSICGTLTNEFLDNPSNIVSSRIVPLTHEEILKFSRRRSPFNHPTVMYKKSEVLECGGYRDINRKEDLDLFVRMLNSGKKAMNIGEPLLLFRSNEDNFYRRKSWNNCKNYIVVIYRFWRKGYSNLDDLMMVTLGQIIMFASPVWLLKMISNKFLRKRLYLK